MLWTCKCSLQSYPSQVVMERALVAQSIEAACPCLFLVAKLAHYPSFHFTCLCFYDLRVSYFLAKWSVVSIPNSSCWMAGCRKVLCCTKDISFLE